jgi:acetyl esterase/lipase
MEIGALRKKLASRPRSDDYRQRRKDMDARALEYKIAPDVAVEPVTANGVRAEWTSTPNDESDAAVLWLHGGGYVIGSLDSHRHLVSEAGRAAKAWALALDYRLAPEHPFPAAVEDAVSGYRYLLSRGIRPGRIAIAGSLRDAHRTNLAAHRAKHGFAVMCAHRRSIRPPALLTFRRRETYRSPTYWRPRRSKSPRRWRSRRRTRRSPGSTSCLTHLLSDRCSRVRRCTASKGISGSQRRMRQHLRPK